MTPAANPSTSHVISEEEKKKKVGAMKQFHHAMDETIKISMTSLFYTGIFAGAVYMVQGERWLTRSIVGLGLGVTVGQIAGIYQQSREKRM